MERRLRKVAEVFQKKIIELPKKSAWYVLSGVYREANPNIYTQ